MKKLFCLIIIMIAISLVPIFSLAETHVTQDDAILVVDRFIHLLEVEYSVEDIIEVKEVYDIYNHIIAYYFLLEQKGNQFYFLISGNKEYSPLLLAGEGELDIYPIEEQGELYYIGGAFLVHAKDADQLLAEIQVHNPTIQMKDLSIGKNPRAKEAWEKQLRNETFDNIETSSINSFPTASAFTINPFTQYDTNVDSGKRDSACGPTTMAAILEFWRNKKGKSSIRGLNYYSTKGAMINYVYSNYGGRAFGQSVSSLSNNLVKYVSDHGNYNASTSSFNNMNNFKGQIVNERPLAVKFDKWFSWKWFGDYAFDYHWVVGIGYLNDGYQDLMKVHDNGAKYKGGGYRDSREQWVDYNANRNIITMVSFFVGSKK